MANVGLFVVSLILLGIGALQLIWPQKIAAHKTQWDAIKNARRNSSTTPETWMVKCTRLGGLFLVAIGMLLLLLSTRVI